MGDSSQEFPEAPGEDFTLLTLPPKLLCLLSKRGISKFPYIDPPPNKPACVPKSLFVPAAGICPSEEDVASPQDLGVVYIPKMSQQLQQKPPQALGAVGNS